jgi:hypothetical protein
MSFDKLACDELYANEKLHALDRALGLKQDANTSGKSSL